MAGLAIIAAGVWLFVRALPALDFRILLFSLVAGIFIIEAPRLLKTFRQRQERLATYVEENASAAKLLSHANSFQRWSWICYVIAIATMFISFKLFGPDRFTVTLGIALALMVAGFALSLFQVFARTSVDFRSLSTAKPGISQRMMWIITGGLFAAIIFALVAEQAWHIPAMNWLYGALVIFLIGAIIPRWIRGWPKDSNS